MRVGLALMLLATVVRPVAAQPVGAPRYEVAAGYAYMHDNDSSYNFPGGWVVSAAAGATPWLWIVGEAGGSYKTLSIPGDPPKFTVYHFMGGPRVTVARDRRLSPFAQVLFGAARATTAVLDVRDTVTDFAYQPGVGIDFNLTRHAAVRLDGAYRIIRANGANSKEPRVAVAAVLGLPK
jgi:hypothetical protein